MKIGTYYQGVFAGPTQDNPALGYFVLPSRVPETYKYGTDRSKFFAQEIGFGLEVITEKQADEVADNLREVGLTLRDIVFTGDSHVPFWILTQKTNSARTIYPNLNFGYACKQTSCYTLLVRVGRIPAAIASEPKVGIHDLQLYKPLTEQIDALQKENSIMKASIAELNRLFNTN